MSKPFMDKVGLSYLLSRIKVRFEGKADLVNGKIPDEQISENIATKDDLEEAVQLLDEAISLAIGSGVLE